MKRADPFYLSAAWKALRRQALKRDGYRCTVCRCDVSGRGQSRVDHIKPRRTHPQLALDLNNVRTLCPQHDNQGHREKGSGGTERIERFVITGCSEDGMPADPDHPWNRPDRG